MNSITTITYYSISPLLSSIILFWKHQLQIWSLLLRVRFQGNKFLVSINVNWHKSVGNRVSAPLKSCVITFIFPWWETEKKIALTIGEWHLCSKCFEDLKFYNKIVKYLMLSGVTVSGSEQYIIVSFYEGESFSIKLKNPSETWSSVKVNELQVSTSGYKYLEKL